LKEIDSTSDPLAASEGLHALEGHLNLDAADVCHPTHTQVTASDFIFRPIIIAKNTGFLLGGQIVAQVSVAILGIYVARTFGVTEYGLYSLAFAFVGMFGLLFSLGVDAIVIRDVARNPLDAWKVFSSALWLRLASFPIAIAILVLVSRLAGYSWEDRRFILLIAIAVGLGVAADLPRSVFQGLQRMELDAVCRGIEKVGTIVLVLLFVMVSRHIEVVAWATIVGAAMGLVVGWAILLALTGHLALPHPRHSLLLLRQAAPLAVSLALIALYQRLPLVILSWFRPFGEVGFYNAALGITAPFALLPLAFVGSMLPALSNLFQSSPQSVDRIHSSVVGYALAIGLPLSVGLGFLAPDIIQVLYGEPFRPATEALMILAYTIPLIFLTTYLTNILIAAKAQGLLLPVTMSNLVIAIVASVLLAPLLGFRGIAIAAVLTECGGLALLLYFTSRWVRHRLSRKIVAIVIATAIMAVGLLLGRHAPIWVLVPLGVGLYAVGLLVTGGLTLREVKHGVLSVVGRG
jgi:PST family polysaccharide transporter